MVCGSKFLGDEYIIECLFSIEEFVKVKGKFFDNFNINRFNVIK